MARWPSDAVLLETDPRCTFLKRCFRSLAMTDNEIDADRNWRRGLGAARMADQQSENKTGGWQPLTRHKYRGIPAATYRLAPRLQYR